MCVSDGATHDRLLYIGLLEAQLIAGKLVTCYLGQSSSTSVDTLDIWTSFNWPIILDRLQCTRLASLERLSGALVVCLVSAS